MSTKSSIEWTNSTWNAVTGCTKLSAGCRYCYAERMSNRLNAMGNPRYARGFEVTLHPDKIELPLHWRNPTSIFVNSMSDLFHELVPDDFIMNLFATMRKANWHRFQVLTKRAERLASLADILPWPTNVWVGVTVEDANAVYRIEHLRKVPASVRFLSIEPLLGPLPDLDLTGIHWVIVGGESGPHARPMEPDWVHNIHRACKLAGVPFFFKQWGGTRKKKAGRLLDGRTWDEMPV